MRENRMAEKLNSKELVSYKEMLLANSIQVDALAQLLIEKGLITEEEYYGKLKEVQREYNKNISKADCFSEHLSQLTKDQFICELPS